MSFKTILVVAALGYGVYAINKKTNFLAMARGYVLPSGEYKEADFYKPFEPVLEDVNDALAKGRREDLSPDAWKGEKFKYAQFATAFSRKLAHLNGLSKKDAEHGEGVQLQEQLSAIGADMNELEKLYTIEALTYQEG